MAARDNQAKDAEKFEQAKLPMVIAAIAIAAGLAIAGTVERGRDLGSTAGGAIVLAGWVIAIAALHRLGRSGSTPRPM